jgi:archaellum component FlaG (FlaF/FlaG flagellin family)
VDKAITTALLIVVSIVMAVMLFNAVYPAVIEGSSAMTGMTSRAEERLRSQIEIVHATGELDSDGWWQDVNGNGDFDVFVWVKNVGSSRIAAVERTDVFFGAEGDFMRIPHESETGGGYPYWTWQVENASEWTPTATLRITIHYAAPLSSGRYFVKVIISNGVSDEHFLSM